MSKWMAPCNTRFAHELKPYFSVILWYEQIKMSIHKVQTSILSPLDQFFGFFTDFACSGGPSPSIFPDICIKTK